MLTLACLASLVGCSSGGGDGSSDGGGGDAGGTVDGGAGGGAGTAGGGAAGGAAGSSGSSGTGATGGTGGAPPIPSCDPVETPSPGIFVSPSGDDATGDGTAGAPFATIDRALGEALLVGAPVVHLDQGTYAEQVDVVVAGSLRLRGGWRRAGPTWERDCSGDAHDATIIASPTGIGVRIAGDDAHVTLETVTILTKLGGTSQDDQPGETLYGVWAKGRRARVTLRDVIVEAGRGSPGGRVTPLVEPAPPDCGNGIDVCSDGSDAAVGAAGPAGAVGTFDSNGYVAGDGGDGMPGPAGNNGTPGAAGTTQTCSVGCVCSFICQNTGDAPVTSGQGTCGCGGLGGRAGGGGKGGGASVGVFVSGSEASLTVTQSEIVTANGGDGSSGRLGEDGNAGTAGADGAAAACTTCIAQSCAVPCGTVSTIPGGAPGGPGGAGGAGGSGGGGSGGLSVGIATFGGVSVNTNETTITIGSPGLGADGAPNGEIAEQMSVP